MPKYKLFALFVFVLSCGSVSAAESLNEQRASDAEWGYRPAAGAVVQVTPPGFSWRPQEGIVGWEVQCARDADFKSTEYRAEGIELNVHCPPRAFPPGEYTWRYRGVNQAGERTNWSRPRTFTIADNALAMPMPPRAELLARIPRTHPRLFVRPEDLPRLRSLAKGPMNDEFKELAARCDRLLAKPPPTSEPPKYGPNVVPNSDPWREVWWGNRTYTITALDSAATLAFTRLLGGDEKYGQLARRILLDCAKWDPRGATGYRYNDEAGMPYGYYFVRTYTFVHDLLSEEEREICRGVIKVRGDEMHRHLYPRHLWKPYSSHSNRAWHFLGEMGIAMLDEVEGADDWVWLATNVFYNVYPVWSDDDGGWHEGYGYWNSYISRFTWWADVMRAAMRVNAYDKPYFSRIGYYPMYLLPPGKVGGGFGDLNAAQRASNAVPLVSQLSTQAGNRHWQWYVRQMDGPKSVAGYVGFIRGALPRVAPLAPDDLPNSRLFRGIGQAVLNTTLRDARDDVQIVFKSSPFGTQSHGYEANNSFLLWAYGQRLLIRSGYRDSYGSDHHQRWMWSTRSVNNITVNGQGQLRRSPSARGRIVGFRTTPSIDIVEGEAGDAYRTTPDALSPLERYTRTIVFVKPELVVIFDRLVARQESSFEYWLHATEKFRIPNQRDIQLEVKDVRCHISLLAPSDLSLTQTDQYDPNPRPRITLREWHLTAGTSAKAKRVEFVALLRPFRAGDEPPGEATLKQLDGGYLLTVKLSDGSLAALLPSDDAASLAAEGMATTGKIVAQRRRPDGSIIETVKPEDQ